MWISDVDVPTELIDAAKAGQLVIFVGAGASLDLPAGLPDFRSLTTEIGNLVNQPPSEADLAHPDVFLGRLADEHGADVHRLVANALGKPGSAPNSLHHAIVRLATVHPSPRIVTTNYDLHLSTAANADGQVLPTYVSPALPVGDDFYGLVHLHGSLDQEPRKLVVTDKDFGRAYLLEAWAARFLERMFSAFTVLFVGYSHSDVVMQYLARSLGASGKRFVCTGNGDDPAWRQYGLTPVRYSVADGTHDALSAFIARWAERTAMGQTQHRAMIADIISSGPPAIPEKVSYLDEALASPERVRYFVELARGPEWLSWVAGRPAFASLFDTDEAETEPSRFLIAWVADNYMIDEVTSHLALRAMRERPWPPAVQRTIVHRLFAHEGKIPTWLSPWLLLALQHSPGSRDDMLDMLLANHAWTNNVSLAISLLEDRTRPLLKPAMSFANPDQNARFEIDLVGDEHWLTEAWTTHFVPLLNEHLEPLIASVSEQIARTYRAVQALGMDFDSFAFGRSAIEPHEQDSFREPMDVLIDAGRDCLEHALVHNSSVANRYLDAWSARTEDLFRRLAVHGWRLRTDRTADEKLQWIEARGWIWELPLQHEVFLLLKGAIPDASAGRLSALTDLVKDGAPPDSDGEVSSYRSYNLLVWLTDADDAHPLLIEAFDEAQAAQPEFAPREHPDLNSYMTSAGFDEDVMPISADELHSRIMEDPTAAIAYLKGIKSDQNAWSGPTWAGALRSMQACVSTYPADGWLTSASLTSDDADIKRAIIRGWGTAELDSDGVDRLLELINNWEFGEVRRDAAGMLSDGGTQEHPTPWHRYPSARATASRLWPTEPVSGGLDSDVDLVMETINHPVGDLARFWTKAVQADWTEASDNWSGLTHELEAELDRMLLAEGRNGLLATTFIASQLHFFYAADRDWTVSRLLPRFKWDTDHELARGAWQGFLTWGHPTDGLLSAGLLDDYLETSHHLDLVGTRLSHAFNTSLASIAFHADQGPLRWLRKYVVIAPEEARVSWTMQVGRQLAKLEPDEADVQWDRWIKEYWAARVEATPLPLATSEASAMAEWLIGLQRTRKDAAALLLLTPAGLPEKVGFLHRIGGLDLTTDAYVWTDVITHLLRGTDRTSPILGHHLKAIVTKLRAADPMPDLAQLIDEALRLGVTEAARW